MCKYGLIINFMSWKLNDIYKEKYSHSEYICYIQNLASLGLIKYIIFKPNLKR